MPNQFTPRIVLRFPGAAGFFAWLRYAPSLQWLGNRQTYAIGVLIVTGLSVGCSLVAPRILGPTAFGTFTLLSSLFLYASKTDLGLSQLADRTLALGNSAPADGAADFLRARLMIGFAILGGIMPVAMGIVGFTGSLSVLDTALAIGAGVAFMIGNGPVTVFRALSKVWEFTATALLLQIGMTAPRLAGLVLGGVTGYFIALSLWYGPLAALLAYFLPLRVANSVRILSLVRLSLPLFVFNAFWELYLSGNRWISAGVSTSENFGLFAFGANLALTGIGMIATIAQIRYPNVLAQIGKHSASDSSIVVEREIRFLCLAISLCAAVGVILTGPMIQFIFPLYERSAPATRALAVSCVPLGVVAAIMPIVISLSSRPLVHAIRLFLPAFLILLGGMTVANWMDSITGQAWACTAAGLALFVNVVALDYSLGIIKIRTAIRVIALQSAAIVSLAGFTLVL